MNNRVKDTVVERIISKLSSPKYTGTEYKQILCKKVSLLKFMLNSDVDNEMKRLCERGFPPKSEDELYNFFQISCELILCDALMDFGQNTLGRLMTRLVEKIENPKHKNMYNMFYLGIEGACSYGSGILINIVDNNLVGQLSPELFNKFFSIFPVAFIETIGEGVHSGKIILSPEDVWFINEGVWRVASTLSPLAPRNRKMWDLKIEALMNKYSPNPEKIDWDFELGLSIDPNKVLGSNIVQRTKDNYLRKYLKFRD